MSFAFMPIYTGDYQRDTRHLSCSEHGIFFQLLMHSWDQKGPIPLDERRVCGIVNARSGDEIEALRRVLSEYFVRMDDGWYNKRMQIELERAEALSAKKSRAGRAGYQAMSKVLTAKRIQARDEQMAQDAVTKTQNASKPLSRKEIQASAQHVLGTCPAEASTPTPTLTPTPTPTLTPTPTRSKASDAPREIARGTRLPKDWEMSPEFLEAGQVIFSGWEPEHFAAIADKFRDYWHAKAGKDALKVDWLATWRTWLRRETTRPTLPPIVQMAVDQRKVDANGQPLFL